MSLSDLALQRHSKSFCLDDRNCLNLQEDEYIFLIYIGVFLSWINKT